MSDNVSDITQEILRDIQARIGGVEDSLASKLSKIEELQAETLRMLREMAGGINELGQVAKLHGSRLNTIDERLSRIERHLGFVDA